MIKFFTKIDRRGKINITSIFNLDTGEAVTISDVINMHGDVICDDLDDVFVAIFKELKKQKVHQVFNATKNNQYSISYNSGNVSNIKILKNNGYLFLCNFKNKYNQEWDADTYDILIKYSQLKGRDASSIGMCAFNELLTTTFKAHGQNLPVPACKTIFRRDYPILHDEILDEAKKYTQGYQLARSGEYYDTYEYDISGSYPAQLQGDTPMGAPRDYATIDDVPDTYWYIVKCNVIRPMCRPNTMDWLSINGTNICTIVLTKHLYMLFLDTYTFFDVKIKRITAFKTVHDKFYQFVQNNRGSVNLADEKCIRKYDKAIANSVVGFFGRNCDKNYTKFDNKGNITTHSTSREPVYLPIYLYVTGKAKAEFIRTLLRVGVDNIVYCNTDGFICTKQLDIDILNIGRPNALGAFRLNKNYTRLYIRSINGYVGEDSTGDVTNTISGQRLLDPISVQQYMTQDYTYTIRVIDKDGDLAVETA